MVSPPHPENTGACTRPLTRAVVACVVIYNAYLLIRSVHSELWGWMIPILIVWFSIPVVAVYAFKRLHQFWAGDRDLQYPASDQIIRALLIGGFIHLVGMAILPKRAEAPANLVREAAVLPYKVPTEAPPGSADSLAEYVSRCSLTQDEQGLVLQTSDGGLHLMDLRSGALISPPADQGTSYEALVSRAHWSTSEVMHLPDENRVVHTRDAQHEVNLGALGLQYIGPAAAPDHFIAFHPTTREFQRLDVTTGQTVWRLPFERTGKVVPSTEGLRLLNPTSGWNLMTFEAFDHRPRYLLLIDDPELLTAARVKSSESGNPQVVFLDSVIPDLGGNARFKIRELVQVPGTVTFLMTIDGGYSGVRYVRFRLQHMGSELGFFHETVIPKGHLLIRPSWDRPDPTLGLSVKEIVLEAEGHPSWRRPDPQRHTPPIQGFSVALERDVLLPSPVEGHLELLRAGQGYLPGVAKFPSRSFARDRHCVAQSAQGYLVAIALGSELSVLFKSRAGDVDAIRQWGIDLPIDAKAAMDGAARR